MRDHNGEPDQDELRGDDVDGADRVSKSQLKRDSHALQSLGEALVDLSRDQLRKFQLPEDLGKLMRNVDAEPIQQAMDDLQGVSAQAIAKQHKTEQWRQRLIDQGDNALQALLQEHPGIDRQRIRQLLRRVQQETQHNKPPKAFRELFKYLREFME